MDKPPSVEVKIKIPTGFLGKGGSLEMKSPWGKFKDNYKPIMVSVYDPMAKRRGKPHGNKKNRKCLFCGEGKPAVTFKKKAHIIPEALGNKFLTSNHECDDCNDKGSILEDSLVNMYASVRMLMGFPGKRGMPKIKKPGGKAYIQTIRKDQKIYIHLDDNDPSIVHEEIGPNKFRLKMHQQPINLVNVAKSLARIAVFMAHHKNKGGFQHLIPWINGSYEFLPTFYQVSWPGPGRGDVVTIVSETSNKALPSRVIQFIYGFMMLIFPLPDNDPKVKNVIFPPLPISKYPPYFPRIIGYECKTNKPSKLGLTEMVISYDYMTRGKKK